MLIKYDIEELRREMNGNVLLSIISYVTRDMNLLKTGFVL